MMAEVGVINVFRNQFQFCHILTFMWSTFRYVIANVNCNGECYLGSECYSNVQALNFRFISLGRLLQPLDFLTLLCFASTIVCFASTIVIVGRRIIVKYNCC